MKTYHGTQFRAYVTQDGETHPLAHHVYHSPDGHSWGYGGSGPSELAKDILWDLLGEKPDPALYQAFKWAFVATWPMNDDFSLSELAIRRWLASMART